jgi:hypothetical protein
MWLSPEDERLLEDIRKNNQLTDKELEAVKKYDGFKEIKGLDPNSKGIGPPLYNELQDILKKYGDSKS